MRGWLLLGAAALLLFERTRPLRRAVDPGGVRLARNAAVGALTAVVVSMLERPLVQLLAREVEERRLGMLGHAPLAPAVKTALAVALMDYTLYWWHALLHRVPLLWRVHEPHHADRDLDASTGVRFHFLEFVASIPWRCAQIALIGVGPRALATWQKLTLAEVLFHHSNVRLPIAFERVLSKFIVTPRMHGVHHSVVRAERDSNFSSGLSIWDRLHSTDGGTREDVVIGLPQSPEDTLTRSLVHPFTRSRP